MTYMAKTNKIIPTTSIQRTTKACRAKFKITFNLPSDLRMLRTPNGIPPNPTIDATNIKMLPIRHEAYNIIIIPINRIIKASNRIETSPTTGPSPVEPEVWLSFFLLCSIIHPHFGHI